MAVVLLNNIVNISNVKKFLLCFLCDHALYVQFMAVCFASSSYACVCVTTDQFLAEDQLRP